MNIKDNNMSKILVYICKMRSMYIKVNIID